MKFIKKICLILLLILNDFFVFGQDKIRVSGYVIDSVTKERLIGAHIFIAENNTGVISNEFGYYSLILNSDDSTCISISYVGYQQLQLETVIPNDTLINFYLLPSIEIDPVEISASRSKNTGSKFTISNKLINALPQEIGESDVIKSLQYFPGVIKGDEGKSVINVRGGSSDQNLFLLDDGHLYNVNHFGGFFSTFDGNAIKNAQVYKSGFPSEYGGKLSSIIDIRMNDGNMEEYEVNGTVGMLTSRISINGPIVKNKVSFFTSTRFSYLPIFNIIADLNLNYNFYDSYNKLNWLISDKDRVYISFYSGFDRLKIKSGPSNEELTNDAEYLNNIGWGNNLITVRYNHIFNTRMFMNLVALNSNYNYSKEFDYSNKSDTDDYRFLNQYDQGINDYGLKSKFSYKISNNVDIDFGTINLIHNIHPGNSHILQSSENFRSFDSTLVSDTERLYENVLFINGDIKLINNRIETSVGVRISNYIAEEYFELIPEPRISVSFSAGDNSNFEIDYSLMSQPIHTLMSNGIGLPSDIFYPSKTNTPVELSRQLSLGYNYTFQTYNIQTSLFYKDFQDLIMLKPINTAIASQSDINQNIINNGVGEAYGYELMAKKQTGKLTGWMALTISKSIRQFEDFNDGESFPFNYDRLINITAVAFYRINENLNANCSWTYGSGFPVNIPIQKYYSYDQEKYIFTYSDFNTVRMRDYHRLDVGLSYTKKHNKYESIWKVGIINVYNRKNPYYYFIEKDYSDIFNSKEYEYKIKQQSLFPIFPSLSYTIEF